jgi:propionyl-CoA carboxylase alpha chain
MFSKILIANRGEIACRIIRTARRMRIKTVAVYSDADRDALHVSMADEAVHIGAAAASESYLSIEKIIAACKQTGAEAVHPGYGFLSERDAFAEALGANGITFIGPNPKAIAAMGDKIESKKFANKAEVSTVPGFLGVIENAAHAVKIADEIGYPVMIKASAGGGGKGMRIAMKREEVAEGFDRARSEAQSSFGDDRVFIEKFITDPRHIEIQLLGDKHGNVVYLHERECSIQRRNQKVLEEAPSPLLDAATRKRMGEQAVALAKAVNYDSAGTVEFVAGQDRSFFFLEMNTRLQVEHPVTEMITGVDLVEEMIRVAAGEKLRFGQEDIKLDGWAVESRIYAEDPTRNFLPSIGRLIRCRPPKEGRDGEASIRVDTGVEEGDEISIHYDPMIAKLVTHAPTRIAAIEAQAKALDAYAIEGIRHNIPFLATVMGQDRWRAGKLSTSYIKDEFPAGFSPPVPQGDTALIMAAVAVEIDHRLNVRKRRISHQMQGWRPVQFTLNRVVEIGSRRYEIEVTEDDRGDLMVAAHLPNYDSRHFPVIGLWEPGQPLWTGMVGSEKVALHVRPILNGVLLSFRGSEARARVYTQREANLAALMPQKSAAIGSKALLCPMPGLVKSLPVSVGQAVKAGEVLAIVEAMKMENVLRAEEDGVIKALKTKPGDSLAVDAVILEFV